MTAKPGLKRRDEIGQLSCSVEKLGQALRRVDVLREEVIANVSHELRSPLALIGGYAEMVRDVNWKDDTQREENLNLIISEANRMSVMVSDILDYSQLQSGCLQLNRGAYDLCEIVEHEVRYCEQTAQENRLALSFDGPGEELNVQVDALKISQVVRNLLNTASSARPPETELSIVFPGRGTVFTLRVHTVPHPGTRVGSPGKLGWALSGQPLDLLLFS